MTAPDPQSGPIPPPRPPAGPVYPPVAYPPIQPPPSAQLSAPPDPMSGSPGSFSGPPAPYSVSPPAPPPARRSQGALLALGVATLSLLVAVVSLAVAWRAVDQAGDAKQFALAGDGEVQPAEVPQPPPTTQAPPATAPAATDAPIDPAPSGSGEPPPLDERTVYTPKYEKQVLTLKAGCNNTMYVDLDEPRANVDYNDYDLGFTRRCAGTSNLSLGEGVEGSESGIPQMTPHDCAERIRTAPVGEAVIPVRKGVVLCVTTSLGKARERGDNQRMVRLEITGAAEDGTVTVQSTAWNIPR